MLPVQSFSPGLGTKIPCAAQHSQRNLKTGALRREKTGPGPKPTCFSLSPPPSWPLLSLCFPFSTQVDSGLLWAPLQEGGALLSPEVDPGSPVWDPPAPPSGHSPPSGSTTPLSRKSPLNSVLRKSSSQLDVKKNVLAYRAPTLAEANVLPELSEKKQVSKDQRTAALTGETLAVGQSAGQRGPARSHLQMVSVPPT